MSILRNHRCCRQTPAPAPSRAAGPCPCGRRNCRKQRRGSSTGSHAHQRVVQHPLPESGRTNGPFFGIMNQEVMVVADRLLVLQQLRAQFLQVLIQPLTKRQTVCLALPLAAFQKASRRLSGAAIAAISCPMRFISGKNNGRKRTQRTQKSWRTTGAWPLCVLCVLLRLKGLHAFASPARACSTASPYFSTRASPTPSISFKPALLPTFFWMICASCSFVSTV